MTDTALIGVDWGTTNLRVLRMAQDGSVLDTRFDTRGAGALARADFATVLEDVCADWLDEGSPVLVCGMAGARARWIEAPYVPCPADTGLLARLAVRAPGRRDVRIVPGVCLTATGLGDVMRGEETLALGLTGPGLDATVIAPGTHSKWISVQAGSICGFRTFMTGELFAAIRTATILGRDMGTAGHCDAAFDAGVDRALSDPALTAALFSVRVQVLADQLGPDEAADYLSGLLIGAEVMAAARTGAPAMLVGDAGLCARYDRAMMLAGHARPDRVDAEKAVALGLWRLWEAMT